MHPRETFTGSEIKDDSSKLAISFYRNTAKSMKQNANAYSVNMMYKYILHESKWKKSMSSYTGCFFPVAIGLQGQVATV